MENVIVKEDAKVLVPNKEHKNFTETKEFLPKGTEIKGRFASIKGLRRGEPFSYRVFIAENGQIIYSDKIKTMKETEVYLGADSTNTPTEVTMSPNLFSTSRMVGALAGGVGAYMYCKKKGFPKSKIMKYSLIGSGLGYIALMLYDKSTNGMTIITPKI
mgnify:CR=1 FL=1